MLVTTADRRLHLFALNQTFSLLRDMSLSDSPILSSVQIGKKHLTTITTSMSGQTVLYDHHQERVLDQRRDHQKYVIKVATCEEGCTTWVATAGWDAKIYLYQLIEGNALRLGEPVASITTATNPEAMIFLRHPDLQRPVLLVTRRDSTSLHYYQLPAAEASGASRSTLPVLILLGSQNLAPHSNAWISFSPSSVAQCPQDPMLLAIATSAVPHMSK